MNTLKDLIRQTKATNSELVTSTIRIPRALNDFVEDFAEQHSKSKQETLLMLLEEGVRIAEELLKEEEHRCATESCAFQLLNTNKRHGDAEHHEMLNNGIAAAYCDPWKFNIDRLHSGDLVFLYENGVGIVAHGVASGETLKKAHGGQVDECHYQVLGSFTKLEKPLHAREVKKILGRNVVFMRTMAAMPDGQKLLDAILRMVPH